MTSLFTAEEVDGSSMDDHYMDDGYGTNEEYNRFVKNSGSFENRLEDETELYDDEILRDDLEARPDINDFQDDFVIVDSFDNEEASFSGDSEDSEMFLPHSPYVPETNVLNTKATLSSLRMSRSKLMSDQLGTGDLLDDETSAAALLALLGMLAVIVFASFLSASWHRTFGSLPVSVKKSDGKQDTRKVSSSPLLKRRDRAL